MIQNRSQGFPHPAFSALRPCFPFSSSESNWPVLSLLNGNATVKAETETENIVEEVYFRIVCAVDEL